MLTSQQFSNFNSYLLFQYDQYSFSFINVEVLNGRVSIKIFLFSNNDNLLKIIFEFLGFLIGSHWN